MKQNSKRTLTPKLRFPEFRGEPGWEEKTGVSLFDQINERNPTPGLPVLAITQEHGAIPRDMIDYHVTVTEKSIESYKVVQVGDFIISLRSFQGGIEYSQYHGICSPAYVILRRRTEGSAAYFKHYLKTDRFIRILTRNLEGLRDGKMISYKQFSELLLPVPPPPEQQRIADCLSSLDGLIAAEGRKLAALRDHKRGLMQQLFPQPGQTQPRLRFPEFRGKGEWRECKLGKLVDISSGKSPSQYDLSSDGKYPFVKVEDLNNCTKYQINSRAYCDDAGDIVPKGSILFPKRGAAIELNKIRITAVEIQIDTNLMAITPRDSADSALSEFLFYYLGHVGLSQIADTSTIPQINNKHIIPFGISAPLLSEQQCIVDGFSALDTQITAQAAKIESLKQHKRGLMQQLFPTPEANGS